MRFYDVYLFVLREEEKESFFNVAKNRCLICAELCFMTLHQPLNEPQTKFFVVVLELDENFSKISSLPRRCESGNHRHIRIVYFIMCRHLKFF